jgi:hypothetical protein
MRIWNLINAVPAVCRYFHLIMHHGYGNTYNKHSQTPGIFNGHLHLFQYYFILAKGYSAQNLAYLGFTHQNYVLISS